MHESDSSDHLLFSDDSSEPHRDEIARQGTAIPPDAVSDPWSTPVQDEDQCSDRVSSFYINILCECHAFGKIVHHYYY